jgi:hypothetical protein
MQASLRAPTKGTPVRRIGRFRPIWPNVHEDAIGLVNEVRLEIGHVAQAMPTHGDHGHLWKPRRPDVLRETSGAPSLGGTRRQRARAVRLCARIRLMRWIDRLGKSQRVVAVIALGLALETLGSYVVNLGSGLGSGWYAYSPLTSGGFFAAPSPIGLHGWVRLIIWLVLIGAWTLGSIRVLRPSPRDATSPAPDRRSGGERSA